MAARLLQVVVFPYRGCSFTAVTRVQIPSGTPNQYFTAELSTLCLARGLEILGSVNLRALTIDEIQKLSSVNPILKYGPAGTVLKARESADGN